MALNPAVVAQVRADLIEIMAFANRVIVITDAVSVVDTILDHSGRDINNDTLVVLTNNQKNLIQDKAVAILTLLKAKAQGLPG